MENGHISYSELAVINKDIIENVQISYNEFPEKLLRYPVNTSASFRCNHGFSLNGSESSTCQTSRKWSQQVPLCEQGNEITHCLMVLLLIFTTISANFKHISFDTREVNCKSKMATMPQIN